MAWMNDPHRCQPVDRLERIDAVTAGDRNAGLGTDRLPTTQDFADDIRREHFDRHGKQCQRQDRPAAHRVDVGERIRGSDTAELEGVIDDRHEEIRGRDHRLGLVELIDRSVVGGLGTDQQCGERCSSRTLSRSASTPGASLQPQPPPWDREVRGGVGTAEVVLMALT